MTVIDETAFGESRDLDKITINLDSDSAIVVFEFLSDFLFKDKNTEKDAEWHALSEIVAQIERQIVSPFRHDYEFSLQKARERLMQRNAIIE